MAGFGQTEKENTKPAIRPLVNTGNLSPCFNLMVVVYLEPTNAIIMVSNDPIGATNMLLR